MNDDLFRTALVTGASRGLGLALARRLAADGWNLIIDARGAEALEAVRAELADLTNVTAIPGDVTDAEHRRKLAEAAREAGGLDVVVNNASILGPSPQPNLLDYPLDVLEEVYRANTVAPLAVIQALKDVLKPGARILNITSDAAVEPYPGWGGYGSSKAALEQISNILAAENPELRVYHVDPGDMRTQLHQEAFPDEDISDRPLPDESVPGLLALISDDLPSGRYQARNLTETDNSPEKLRQLRVALTVDDFDRAARVYRDAFGLAVEKEWSRPEGRGIILRAGPASIELVDHSQAAYIDEVEADEIEAGGHVSGPVRLAFEVEAPGSTAEALQEGGAKALGGEVETPWGHLNRRLQTAEGLQITLYRSPDRETAGREVV
ncbi:MAG TPA: SDR family NAD(P)-dependent oxidoreductase [Rubrobacteraceae bacterium]|nr:SDR family NAD(P)-dependent oxidoreductase [Rubrobacteraceae bacterium]